jgi:hypothetical protein
LAQKAEIDEKIAAAEQQKVLLEQKTPANAQSNSATPYRRQQSTSVTKRSSKDRGNDVVYNGKNTNRTARQRRQDMTAMIAAASQQNLPSIKRRTLLMDKKIKDQQESKPIDIETPTSDEKSDGQPEESNKTEER